jgi:hypothetical protein
MRSGERDASIPQRLIVLWQKDREECILVEWKGRGNGKRQRAEETLERARKNIGSRVERNPEREIASRRHGHATDGRRTHRPLLKESITYLLSFVRPVTSLELRCSRSLSCGESSLSASEDLSLSTSLPAFWPHFLTPPFIGGE